MTVLPPEHRAPYLGPAGAWTRGTAVASVALTGISAAGITAAWVGASGRTQMDDVVPFLVLGVVAFAVGGLAGAVWLGGGLRSVRAERVALRRRLLAMDLGRVDAVATADVRVIGPGMTKVHRPDCEYVRGKEVSAVPADAEVPECLVCAA